MNSLVLTRRHLTVIRAALRFWSDEHRPDDSESLRLYGTVSEPDTPSADEVNWITQTLPHVELRYLVYSNSESRKAGRLFETLAAALMHSSKGKHGVVTVLMPGDH